MTNPTEHPTPPTPHDTITTPDQLDALPPQAVIRGDGDEVYERLYLGDGPRCWYGTGVEDGIASAEIGLPATVLYRPDAPARGSADAETLRAEVEALRADRTAWRAVADQNEAERDAARTEAATLRTAIEGFRARLVDPVRLATEGSTVGVVWALDKIDRVLAAHPAPEAAPPTLTVTRERIDLAVSVLAQQHGHSDVPPMFRSMFTREVMAVVAALGAIVVDGEADR
jgi:hypothetical protein